MKKIEIAYMVYWIFKDDSRNVNWGKEQLSSYEKSVPNIYINLYNDIYTILEERETYLDKVSFIKEHRIVKNYMVYTK